MLELVPITRDEADFWIEEHHRHLGKTAGAVFRIAAAVDGEIVGVLTAGRPVARHLDDGWTLEVNRCCTDGTRNACSFLYGAAWRAAKALGWRKLITYTLPEEGGATLRAAGWTVVGERGGGKWSRKDRPRLDTQPQQRKLFWVA